MKQLIYISIFLSTLTMIFTSCDDYLDVKSKSTFSDDVIFAQPELAEGYIFGIYDIMMRNNSYRNRLGMYMGINTDTEYRTGVTSNTTKASTANAREAIGLYAAVPGQGEGFNNTDEQNPWSYIYQALEACNLAISGIQKYGNPTPENQMGYLLGEALTLRAFFYNDLVKWWGDVPARFAPLTAENLYIPKTPRAEIYAQIIADLGEASELVPWEGNGIMGDASTVQRVNKAFVKGLRARICLAAAGKAMLPVGTTDSKIDYVFEDESTRREYYSIAKQECWDIIESGKFRLESDFTKIFKDQCQFSTSLGRESIFELPYKPASRGQMYYFFGMSWAKDSVYVTGNLTSIGGTLNVVPSFFYDFNDNDTRKNATAAPYTMKYKDRIIQPEISNVTAFQLNKWRADYFTSPMTNNDDGVGMMVMRYADVLLMYAEADLYTGATNGADYLNLVRRRAFGGSTAYDLALTLENIQQERAFEFCGENVRKYDLIRWGLLGTNLRKCQDNMKAIKDQTGNYASVPQTIYWRLKDVTGKTREKYMEIYGLNRGEYDDKTVSDPTGGWTKAKWTNGTVTTNDVTSDRISDIWLQYFLFHNDPDKRQLLPIMNAILTSNPMLSNDYGY